MTKENLIDLDKKQLDLVKKIVQQHIPEKEVWIYGSRVNWKAHDASDLDLAVFTCSPRQIHELKEAFEESNLLISVDVMDWEKIPKNFKSNIKKKYVVLQKKNSQNNKIKISLSSEHRKYVKDIEQCFGSLDIEIKADYIRKSVEELPMQVLIFLSGAISTGITWDIIKKGIKKVLKKFKKTGISIRDEDHNIYNINSDGQVVHFNPSIKRQEIGTIDDLFKCLQKENNSWQKVRLGDIAKVISGQSPKSQFYNENQEGIPFYQGKKDFGEIYLKDPTKWTTNVKKVANPNDILMSVRAPVGPVNITLQKVCIGRGLASIRAININRTFLFYFLKKNQDKIVGVRGSVFDSINQDAIKEIQIPFPPLSEQKAIAEVLSSLDDKIELLHRQNKTLEDIAQTLFRKWFIEDAKKDWKEGYLSDVVKFFDSERVPLSKMQRDRMKQGKLYPYYGATTVMDYINHYIFDGEYVLLGEDGTVRTKEGYPVLQYATGKFWVNNHTHIFQAIPPYTNFFIWLYLLKKNIDHIVTGAVQPKINQTNLKNLYFPKFPIYLVDIFNKKIDNVFKKIKNNKALIQKTKIIRDTLLPKLITGDLKINNKGVYL